MLQNCSVDDVRLAAARWCRNEHDPGHKWPMRCVVDVAHLKKSSESGDGTPWHIRE